VDDPEAISVEPIVATVVVGVIEAPTLAVPPKEVLEDTVTVSVEIGVPPFILKLMIPPGALLALAGPPQLQENPAAIAEAIESGVENCP